MNTRIFIPQDPQLCTLIDSIWQVDTVNPFLKEQILPKGIIEIIFNFSDDSRIFSQIGARRSVLPACFINGFNDRPIDVELPVHQVFFGVVIQPMAVKKIFRTPASEFANRTVDLTLVDPSLQALWHQMAASPGFDERRTIFLDWLKDRTVDWSPQERALNSFFYDRHRYHFTVNEVANAICYSPRQLSRKIIDATGMNTEEILLYKKYLHAVQLVHETDLPLTSIAYDSQFSDQAHFTRTFKSLTGMTPGEYRRNKGRRIGHVYDNVR